MDMGLLRGANMDADVRADPRLAHFPPLSDNSGILSPEKNSFSV